MKARTFSLLLLAAGCGHVGLSVDEDWGAELEGESLGGSPGNTPATGSRGGGDGDGDRPEVAGSAGSSSMVGSGGVPGCVDECKRVEDGLVLLYEFDEGEGNLARDTSGFLPALNLSVPQSDSVMWVESGLRIVDSTLLTSAVPAIKLRDAVEATNEISLEVWVQSADAEQSGPARFFTVSEDSLQRNFTIAQDDGRYIARLRTSDTTFNGQPDLTTEPGLVTDELSHLLYTRASNGEERIYLNGQTVAQGVRTGTLTTWTSSYHLGVANEFEMTEVSRAWHGTIYLIAVYNRALSAEEAKINARAPH